MSDLKKIKDEFLTKLKGKLNISEINQIKSDLFGKSGLISSQFKKIGTIAESERKKFASDLNIIKDELQDLISSKINEVESNEINKKLEKEKIDVTLPERPFIRGKIHPVSQTIDEISSIFSEIGFSVEEGPDVENEYNNFTALNTPENHPARDMHDTFYLDEKKQKLLRTHTSPVQIRTMLKDKPPFKIIAPGRTYRSDSDQTHSPIFTSQTFSRSAFGCFSIFTISATLNNSLLAERLSTLSTSRPMLVSCSKRFFSFRFVLR